MSILLVNWKRMDTHTGILNSKEACFYHPIKVVFLDDNPGFLDAISLEFNEQKNLMMFTNPDEAMDAIKRSKDDALKEFINIDEEYAHDSNPTLNGIISVNKIVHRIYDNSRFDNVAVLVVDYAMPNINGIEFCQQLNELPFYKILLTAEADKDTAINAFNNGIIDKFILKTNQNLHQELTSAINELTNKYFQNSSRIIIQSCGESLKRLLKNEQYKKVFDSIILNTKSIEYYLVDRSGSFLFLTVDACPTWLIVCDQDKSNEQVDLLKGYGFSELLIKKIKERESLLFLYSENEYKEQIDCWEKYIFDSKRLDNNYSYSIVHDRLTKSINWDQVVSYEK